jgi:predicted transcriptional regulator
VLPAQIASPTDLTLSELRRELDLTQVQLAEQMDVSQRAISHLEHEPNPRVGTLSSYVHGLGGRLELRAVFTDRTISVNLHESQ